MHEFLDLPISSLAFKLFLSSLSYNFRIIYASVLHSNVCIQCYFFNYLQSQNPILRILHLGHNGGKALAI